MSLKNVSKNCFRCKKEFETMNLKTTRSRFRIMGLVPPYGMGESDRICVKCLNIIYNEEIKRRKISQIRKQIQN